MVTDFVLHLVPRLVASCLLCLEVMVVVLIVIVRVRVMSVCGTCGTPVSLEFFFGAFITSGNAFEALHLEALFSSISLCMAILDDVGLRLLSNGGFNTGSKSLSCPLYFTPC